MNFIKIRSKYLGEIEIEGDQTVCFPQGLPAFEEERQFVIIPFAADSPFFYLQAVNNEQLCFILADIFTFFPAYEIELNDRDLQRLKINVGSEAYLNVFAVLTVPEICAETTANLMAPVIINFDRQVGMQYIPRLLRYHSKYPLFEESILGPIQGVR
ncbi:MAG: flagellar assembly protein FliW [Syntrophomonadaceae bacterium]|nr:flagellar assembly protein FliW [Syntrophomonadaceae bacterium]